MRTILAIVLLLAAAAPLGAQQSAQQDAAVEERIRRVENGLLTPVIIAGSNAGMRLDERMRRYNVPGLSIAVINDGRIEWAKGYGVAEAGGSVPVDTATLFQAASISKPVAAMGALRLVEQGRLALDADVTTSLTSWQLEDNGHTATQKVTLRRLLSHNAGLTVHGFRGYAAGEPVPTAVQVLAGAAPANSRVVRPDTTPGAIWRYSGGGSTVAQLLMQDVTGRAFPDLMRELVLAPAGMPHSGYEQPLPAARAASAAVAHRAAGQPVTGRWHTYPEMFAAGLWTTPSDLARLALDVQRAYHGEPGRILSPAMTREMLTVQAGEYGLGFGVAHGDGWTSFSHGGSNEGFRAMFFAFADRGQGAVVMTNGDLGGQVIVEVLRAIAEVYDWPTQRAVVRDVAPIDQARLAAFVGTYAGQVNATSAAVSFTVDGSSLRSDGRPLGERTLFHAGDDRFFHLDGTGLIRFERDVAGSVTAVILEAPGGGIRLARVP